MRAIHLGVPAVFLAACFTTVAPEDPVDAAVSLADGATFRATLITTSLSQDCQPAIGPTDDRMIVATTLHVRAGSAVVGPIMVSGATLVGSDGTELARFEVEVTTVPALQPGAESDTALLKKRDSGTPTGMCQLCEAHSGEHQSVAVRMTLSGPGIPPGTVVSAAAVRVECSS